MDDEQPRKSPEVPPEVGPEAPGSQWLTMPEVATLLSLSERAARDWVKRHDLPLRGTRPVRVAEDAVLVAMEAEAREPRNSPEASRAAPGSSPEGPGNAQPIEAVYRVAGEATAEVALVPLVTMVEELRGLADQLNDMARRNEALAVEVGQLRERQVGQQSQLLAKDEALAAQDETIAELRRRAEAEVAEVAEQRRVRGERRRRATAHVLKRREALGVSGHIYLSDDEVDQAIDDLDRPPPPTPTPPLWKRLRNRLRGA